ncbi:hypothetical protein KUTeg_020099 [Tegillarca granosa]|uniref:Uncharacterized protein n=1 Tax=Tegillarca granosa TaxID=220873 RepID=A0ABQ9EB45_TEGGR|nr:hypothetical protein KUTeg_020099 [Tegillarca granosa]
MARHVEDEDVEIGSHLDSAHSYYSVVSPGGTRHVRRRRRREDGTYSDSESYHSSDDKKDSSVSSVTSDSGASSSEGDYSYASEVSEGGTRRTVKKQRIRDKDGNVIGYGTSKPTKRDHREEKESIKPKRATLTLIKSSKGSANNGEVDPNAATEGNKEEEEVWPGAEHHIPSDFSDDSSSDDNVDLSKMTDEEKKEYFENKERRRQEREKRRREKYGSKYDDIMERRERKRKEQQEKEREERERLKREQEQKEKEVQEKLEHETKDKLTRRESSFLRRQSTSSHLGKPKDRPRSMVTYEKGTPRDFGYSQKVDNREHGLSHDSWKKPEKGGDSHSRREKSDNAFV